jgi:KaiC/GvpD/RAD55 family RecA-like ATPase
METTEALILRNLIYNEDFTRKVLPFIKTEYFNDTLQKVLYDEISSFVVEYNALPTQESLYIELEKRTDLNEESFANIVEIVSGLSDEPAEKEWLLKTTEQWCKDRAVYLAIRECIQIADGSDSKLTKEAIPSILSDALAVSFDSHIGHDYLEDSDARYESYILKEEKLPFDLSYFNRITGGGLSAKTLTVLIASTGIGKSLVMCHFAASYLLRGKNVLYITLEMSEEKIAQRIDANLLDVDIKDFSRIAKSDFDSKVKRLSSKTQGKLIVKEYPPVSAHAGHFRAFINELKLKKSFTPDVIIVDYLNICASSRFKSNGQANSYTIVKSIAEEVRSIAVEFDVPVISATQTNRNSMASSDLNLSDTSESIGITHTVDYMFGLISTEELEGLNQILVKQLKNRYGALDPYRRFTVGIDRAKMRLYDVEQEAQETLVEIVDLEPEKKDFKSKFKNFNFD